MNKTYPQEYIQIINDLLIDQAPLFWQAVKEGSPAVGLRINPFKTRVEDIQNDIPGTLQHLAWSAHGYALQDTHGLGKHPYHAAGLFYLQEPSAMVPVAVLDPQPGERVLDLCAAPGGKSTQIQSRMGSKGILIANDSNPSRVQSLSRNLERWGAQNTAVLCETPDRLSKHLGDFFDRVLVDAPCSGEGTFRSDPGEINKWSPGFIQRCSRIQDEILWFAGKLVRPGGVLVYSTCTFNQDENEAVVARFLEKCPDFYLDPIKPREGFSPGIQLQDRQINDLSGMVRIWPHLSTGEGHFAARMRRSGPAQHNPSRHPQDSSPLDPNRIRPYEIFFETALIKSTRTIPIQPGSSGLRVFGNRLYWTPADMPSLTGLNVRHWGWWLGTFKSDKFTPSPALGSALSPEDAQKVIEFSLEEPRLISYLRGSPLSGPWVERQSEGWALVTCSGYSLGWGLIQRGRMKSYIPRWLRSN